MNKEYENTLLYMKKEKKIRIILLGEYSSGKSSLLNTIIGRNLNILPVDTKGYNRFIQPLIIFSKRYISVYILVYKGYKVIKNEWNLIKNSYKTTRN